MLKQQYLDLYNQVSGVMFEIDPMGINFEDNTDEYNPETDLILPKIKECGTSLELRAVVVDTFVKLFDQKMADQCNQNHFTQIADKIWDLAKHWDESKNACT